MPIKPLHAVSKYVGKLKNEQHYRFRVLTSAVALLHQFIFNSEQRTSYNLFSNIE